jgi:hypothetical protein
VNGKRFSSSYYLYLAKLAGFDKAVGSREENEAQIIAEARGDPNRHGILGTGQ